MKTTKGLYQSIIDHNSEECCEPSWDEFRKAIEDYVRIAFKPRQPGQSMMWMFDDTSGTWEKYIAKNPAEMRKLLTKKK